MKPQTTANFIKYLLVLQILVVIGVGICEIVQLVEINQIQESIVEPLEEWDHMVGYTSDAFMIITRIYYWTVTIISIGVLGWLLDSFERRWENIQEYDSGSSKFVILLMMWFAAIVPSIIILSKSSGIKLCSASSYSYAVTPGILRHCSAYIASLSLAYIFIFTILIQLLIHFIVIKRQKKLVNPPPIMERPKLTKIRRSKRVSKRRASYRSSSAFSNGTRLSIVTEDEEERSVKSDQSVRSNENKNIQEGNNEYSNEIQMFNV